MRWFPFLLTTVLLLAACGRDSRPLPFPTPAQSDLVVLTQQGPLTYTTDETGATSGLEYDLIEAFAQELGVGVRYIIASPEEFPARLARGEAHFAAAWHAPTDDPALKPTPPFLHSRDVLVQHEASLPIEDVAELKGRTVHALAGSRQAAALKALQATVPDLKVVEEQRDDVFALLEDVGDRRVDIALVDSAILDIAYQFVPSLQDSLEIGDVQPIAWLFGEKHNPELFARASAFIARIQKDGTLARVEDRYFGHAERLKEPDITKFLEQVETTLPKLRRHFIAAQNVSGIDWRLLAAIAYQESQWDANATSPTGVRGIMMLTEETADRLGVGNRLDPKESIVAGSRYVDILKNMLPDSANEPDRTWLALAAYNIGPGHFTAARTLARQLNADPDAWYDMKRILPLLAQPKYYQRLKSGRARGGEAVILVENIRSYYEILNRHELPYRPIPTMTESMICMSGMLGEPPGLKRPKR